MCKIITKICCRVSQEQPTRQQQQQQQQQLKGEENEKGVIRNDFGNCVLVQKAVDSPLLGKLQTRKTCQKPTV